ncbi:lysosomal membrane ascorbate-dependent ferrireductase CYB561A3 isoform X2 [Echinops telfairi]|uniref:Lysosomal membrane ascorbate-dependent ferrireductase CYB561A3 isoform X2 n=1 Tax=Echinops telfairi TaxID=9371 RepID=A0AC55DML8_ECHTE|nr:lysosomal membrane ascorbate-dependent ferrireductase CYB561A3 isoform X2 [Echinops telfairi]
MAVGRFYLSCLALGTLGSLCILLTIYWMQHWHSGFAWDSSSRMFNWHPVLMVAGMVVVYGAASLVYRLPQAWVGPKLPWKMLHAVLHLMAFVLVVLGLVAVFKFHNHQHISNLYSLHSWLGILTVFLFACQLFFSLKNTTKPYSSLPAEAVLANSTGLLVVVFVLLVLYILASSWKRPEPGVLTDRQLLPRPFPVAYMPVAEDAC